MFISLIFLKPCLLVQGTGRATGYIHHAATMEFRGQSSVTGSLLLQHRTWGWYSLAGPRARMEATLPSEPSHQPNSTLTWLHLSHQEVRIFVFSCSSSPASPPPPHPCTAAETGSHSLGNPGWKLNSDPLQEQQAPLTKEPTLQGPHPSFKVQL